MIMAIAVLLTFKEISYIKYLISEKQKIQAVGVALMLIVMLIAAF